MDREAEELLLVEVGGETFEILLRSSRSKLARTLSLSLLLPLSFATMALCLLSSPLLLPISNRSFDLNFVDYGTQRDTTLESGDLQQARTRSTIFIFEFWMLSTAAVFYTAASIYTGSEVSSAKALPVVSIAWKRLVLALFWFFTIVLAYTMAYILALFLLMSTAGFRKYVNSGELLFGSIPIPAVFFCILVYINMVGYLASVISVLQEKYYGMAAMRKRRRVIKRKRTTVLVMLMLYFIFSQGLGGILWNAVIDQLQRREARAVYETFLSGLLCLVMLWGLLIQSEL